MNWTLEVWSKNVLVKITNHLKVSTIFSRSHQLYAETLAPNSNLAFLQGVFNYSIDYEPVYKLSIDHDCLTVNWSVEVNHWNAVLVQTNHPCLNHLNISSY